MQSVVIKDITNNPRGRLRAFAKGSLEAITKQCKHHPSRDIVNVCQALSFKGCQVLGIAERTEFDDLKECIEE